ncbi:MAG: S-layer homology domain-containing protein [Oscillospiraceae bacterium]|nr:S-layer homology domain-containing protein [Oscillospiraceae bacterium]
MKKLISIILALTVISSLLIPASAANIPADDDIEAILDVMGIMTYDARGNFNEGQSVSRAALAKILVSASTFKGAASSSSRISPFADVLFTHWGAPYISIASKNKFMTGYSDGTFRPDTSILYEEALSAILRLLGYTSADYTAAYPAGQIAKADDIGLTESVNAYVGNPVPRSEMAKLVYNFLNTPKKGESSIYAVSLGYTPTSELLTIGDVFKDNVTGPVTVKPGTLESLNLSAKRVYKDGVGASISDIESFDVIYYSKTSGSVWAYSKKISGIINDISPNKESPTSVTVSGVTYPLTYYAAQRAFGLDGLENGQTVTMLLDKNGKVCDAYKASDLYESVIGVMTGVSSKTITAADGTKTTGYYASILTLDGSTIEISQNTDSDAYVGKAVSVDMATGRIRTYSSSSISGYINYDAHLIGQTPIASNLKIVELDDNGNMISPTLSRLDGVNIKSGSVLLASKNASGAVDGLILKNVTGDMHKYGIITDIVATSNTDRDGTVTKGSNMYTYDLGGMRGTISFARTTISLTEGPCVFMYKDGDLVDAKNLARGDNVSVLTPEYATLKSGVKHKISPNVLVYKVVGDDKILTSLDEALTYDGTIWVYYDDIQSAGGLVRVIYIK